MYLDKFLNYLSFERKYSNHTIYSYDNDVKGFLNFLKNNNTKIDNDLNYSFIRQWIVELSERKISPVTINRKTSSLKSYFKSADGKDIPYIEYKPKTKPQYSIILIYEIFDFPSCFASLSLTRLIGIILPS